MKRKLWLKEEIKKTMLRDEEKAMVEGEKGRVNIDLCYKNYCLQQ